MDSLFGISYAWMFLCKNAADEDYEAIKKPSRPLHIFFS